MTASAKGLFINLSVRDLKRSMEFFRRLGFKFDRRFTDDQGACMIVNDHAHVVLLSEPFFQTFTKRQICDRQSHTESVVACSCGSRAELDEITARLVEAGLAVWAGDHDRGSLIVRGQANLLEDVTALADLERLRTLFEMLETRETMLRLLDASKQGEGVQIFIGAENRLFGVAGCSMVIAPYQNSREQIVGAIGVIGPTRINYARIIPMVDYTAKMIGRLIG